MLRIHFTSEDLGRVRVKSDIDPLWEITNSFQMLRGRLGGQLFSEWRKGTRARLSPASRLLAPLLPGLRI
jgi:hypothetical protein